MIFLANENFPLASIKRLRLAGHNVASVGEDSPGDTDDKVMRRAFDENRIILTFDRDYGELVYRYGSFVPTGIVYFRFDPAAPDEPGIILQEIINNDLAPLNNKFTVIERGRIRQKTLTRT